MPLLIYKNLKIILNWITFPNFLDKKFTQIPCLHQCWSLASLASANLARVRPQRNKARQVGRLSLEQPGKDRTLKSGDSKIFQWMSLFAKYLCCKCKYTYIYTLMYRFAWALKDNSYSGRVDLSADNNSNFDKASQALFTGAFPLQFTAGTV